MCLSALKMSAKLLKYLGSRMGLQRRRVGLSHVT